MGSPLLRVFLLLPVILAVAAAAGVLILVWTVSEHLRKRKLCTSS
jgi:hypothetical protein